MKPFDRSGSASVARRRKRHFCGFAAALVLTSGLASAAQANEQFGNDAVALDWQGSDLAQMRIVDGLNDRTIAVTAPFALHLEDGTVLTPADLVAQGAPQASTIAGDPNAARLADRGPRKQLVMHFADRTGRFAIDWALTQLPDAKYLRGAITITALKADEKLTRIDLFTATAPQAEVMGRVNGSPIVAGPDYLQFESPLSKSEVGVDRATIRMWIDRALPIEKGKSVTYSAAIGVTRPGQLRRDFQTYLGEQRAHPYRPFLHYNSWYDIGYDTQYTQAQALDRINTFCSELAQKRGVKIDSFLFDAGWDDLKGSWDFSPEFPDGFVPVKKAAAKCGAAPGVWLSPWGGYDTMKIKRIAGGRDKYEVVDGGFALSGPKYYPRFHDVAVHLVTDNGVNMFKFDGFGNADQVVPGSRFDSDFAAAIALIDDLRTVKPDLFLSLTIGTYPSPAWLRYADTIWRGGQDHAFTGVGTQRNRWITYRDQQEYENIAIGGPLFPLNSVMLHGIIYAQHAAGLNDDPGHDFAREVHSYFGSGTQLQEMYITPSLLTNQNWDTLADAANWSRRNADVLRDTHWIGGDPGRLQVYGWAAWSPAKSIVTLRNPDSKPRFFLLDAAHALELPDNAVNRFTTATIWSDGAAVPARIDGEKPVVIRLHPFEVLTIELTPDRADGRGAAS